MKAINTLLFTALLCAFASCDKQEHISDADIRQGTATHASRETRVPMPGIYEGIITITIPGYVENSTQYTRRTITYITGPDEVHIKWCDIPDTFAIAQSGKEFGYVMTLKFSSSSCGQQDAIFDYTVQATSQYDSLFESGTIRYRWYYEGELRRDLPGTFTAKLRRQ